MESIRRGDLHVKSERNTTMTLNLIAAGAIEASKSFRRLKERLMSPALQIVPAAHEPKHPRIVLAQPGRCA